MMRENEKWLEFLREHFPEGCQVRVRETVGPHPPMEPGATGELEQIDDGGHFHVRLKNGDALTLVLGEDRFSVEPPEPQLLKLYMPMSVTCCEEDEDGYGSDVETSMDDYDAIRYATVVDSALRLGERPEEASRGLMHYYNKDDGVNRKVRSYRFTAEARGGKLWGVAECMVAGRLTPEELETLKETVTGQASDGFGEAFEQHPIDAGERKELYVYLWQPGTWCIQTEQELFGPKLADGLPELCYSTLPSDGSLIIIRRGWTKYFPAPEDAGSREANEKLARELNDRLGITYAQEKAMNIGSMFGWDKKGADPKVWERGPKMEWR